MHTNNHSVPNNAALTAAGGTPPSGPRIAQSSRDLRIQLPAISSRPANSRGFGSEPSISAEFRETVAMFAVGAFFGFVGGVVLLGIYFLSMLIDWYGVAEAGFRLFDFT